MHLYDTALQPSGNACDGGDAGDAGDASYADGAGDSGQYHGDVAATCCQ